MPDSEPLRKRVIEIVESFPEALARPVAGLHLRLEVREKRFGWFMEDHHGNGRLELNFKAEPGASQSLVQSGNPVYYIPSYNGHLGWVGVWLDVPGQDWEEIADLLYDAYLMTVPKSMRKTLPAMWHP